MLLTGMGGIRLRLELDRVPLWRGNGDHVGVKQLAEDFARYLYLPRLRDREVLTSAIQEGVNLPAWATDTFAYAGSWDPETNLYHGLCAGQTVTVIIDDHSVIVKPETALKQIQAQQVEQINKTHGEAAPGIDKIHTIPRPGEKNIAGQQGGGPVNKKTLPRRFHGTVKLDPARIARDAGQIAEEVVQHLVRMAGAGVSISLEIHAQIPNGAPDDVVRTVTENCKTLKFTAHDFEEE